MFSAKTALINDGPSIDDTNRPSMVQIVHSTNS